MGLAVKKNQIERAEMYFYIHSPKDQETRYDNLISYCPFCGVKLNP